MARSVAAWTRLGCYLALRPAPMSLVSGPALLDARPGPGPQGDTAAMGMRFRGIRGATTVELNDPDAIREATTVLLT